MIRRVYLDFLRKKILNGNIGWFFQRGWQYILIHLSYIVRKPLCGPILGTFFVTYRCNYHCKMCNFPCANKKFDAQGLKEFSTDRMKGILKEFAALGTAGIGFTGGEPLLRPDICELLSYAKSLKMITLLNTNGFFLDRNKAKEVLLAGIDSINISLDGASALVHDRIRSYPGAFTKTLKAIETINEARNELSLSVRLKVVTVLDETNIKDIPAITALAKEKNIDCVEFIPQQPFSMVDRARFTDTFFAELDKAVEYLSRYKDMRPILENSLSHLKLFRQSFRGNKSPLKCYAAYNSCAVDCYGQVYPCMPWINWNKPVGNISVSGLKRLWYSREYNRVRKGVCACRDCYLNCQTELNLMFNLPIFKYD